MLYKVIILPLLFLVVVNTNDVTGLSPILIVPGYTGSQLEARISDGSPDCDTGGKWINHWVDTNLLAKPQCINKVLRLQYDSSTNTYMNSEGVEVRVPGFGKTETVEFLDTTKTIKSFHTFVEHYVAKGYERGKTIRAAPYDWRLAPDGLKKIGYYKSVKRLIEKMHRKSNDKVSIVVHSMGGPVTLYFLNNIVSQDWKDKYIKTFIPLSGAWSGGNSIVLSFVSAILKDASEYEQQFAVSFQSMESTVYLLPNPSVWKDRIIITTDTDKYSANDYEKLFKSMDRITDYTKIKDSLEINGDYPAPNVSVHCFYGVGVDTVEVINYGNGFPNKYDDVTCGDGDGSVNLLSSEVCLKWSKEMTAPFQKKIFDHTTHLDMITAPYVLAAVDEAIGIP